jgi:hypothetical protein
MGPHGRSPGPRRKKALSSKPLHYFGRAESKQREISEMCAHARREDSAHCLGSVVQHMHYLSVRVVGICGTGNNHRYRIGSTFFAWVERKSGKVHPKLVEEAKLLVPVLTLLCMACHLEERATLPSTYHDGRYESLPFNYGT